MEKKIITSLSLQEFKDLQVLSNKIIVVKFGAKWCAPCNKIKPLWDSWILTVPENIIIADIDIDESIDLYVQLKTKKMVKGIPTILAFYGNVKRDQYYIPDDSVSGGNEQDVQLFMNRTILKSLTLV
jgi:thiol-disulfide isomerase/thioredoxin